MSLSPREIFALYHILKYKGKKETMNSETLNLTKHCLDPAL